MADIDPEVLKQLSWWQKLHVDPKVSVGHIASTAFMVVGVIIAFTDLQNQVASHAKKFEEMSTAVADRFEAERELIDHRFEAERELMEEKLRSIGSEGRRREMRLERDIKAIRASLERLEQGLEKRIERLEAPRYEPTVRK